MRFAEKMIRLRKAKGLSQEELAELLGVSRQAVSRWEQENTYPDLPNLQKIVNVFGVSADYLIRDDCAEDAPAKQGAEPAPKDAAARFDFKKNRFLIVGVIWIFSALCFTVSALSTGNSVFLGLVLADILLACMNFALHFLKKP